MSREIELNWPEKGYVSIREHVFSNGSQLYHVEGLIKGIHSFVPVPLKERKSLWRYMQGEIEMNHAKRPRVIFNNSSTYLHSSDPKRGSFDLALDCSLNLEPETREIDFELGQPPGPRRNLSRDGSGEYVGK